MNMTSDQERVRTLHGYGLLDTPNEPLFDEIVQEAARELRVPIALISLIDSDRQWFKARVGLTAQETPRSISFCTHAIHHGETMVVHDATLDDRFADNPLVRGDPSIRFYAGAPLIASNGHRIGTLCVIDRQPHPHLSREKRETLERLAARTMELFEARKADQKHV